MKIKIAAIIVALLLLPGVAIAYSLNTAENTTEDLATDVEVEDKRLLIKANDNEILPNHSTDNLEITVTTDHYLYQWIFQPVKISIAIENQGEEDQTLTFPTYQTCDFVVKKGGRKVYQWSDDKLFRQEFKYVTIPVGETWWHNLTWKQIRPFLLFPLFHCKVLPGIYDITGEVPAINRIYYNTTGIKIVFIH